MNARDSFPRTVHSPPRWVLKYPTAWRNSTSDKSVMDMTFYFVQHFYKRPEAQALLKLLHEMSDGMIRNNGETYMHHYRRVASGSVFFSLLTQEIDTNALYLRYLIGLGHDGIEDIGKSLLSRTKFDELAETYPILNRAIQKIKGAVVDKG